MVGTIISDFFFFIIHGQIETVHVCKRATCIYHFMNSPPPPHQPNSEKKIFMDLSNS